MVTRKLCINYLIYKCCCIIVLVFLIQTRQVLSVEYYTEKPNYILTCKIYEPDFTACSTKSIQGVFDQINGEGIPEFTKKFGSFDPLKLDELDFKQDGNQAASIHATLTNLDITGFSEINVIESRVSKKDFSWLTKVLIPKMRIEGDYAMDGRVLVLPLSGKGKFFIALENVDILLRAKTKLYEKDKFTFYNVTQVGIEIDMKGLKTNFDNLFNGKSKEVEKSTNEFFNENWREFFEALRPLITKTVDRVLMKILVTIFDLFPANFFVADIPTSKQLYNKEKIDKHS